MIIKRHHRELLGGRIITISREGGKRGKESPHPLGWQVLGHSGQWGLWNTPESNPGQSSSIATTVICLW